jgi:hypothetical protein
MKDHKDLDVWKESMLLAENNKTFSLDENTDYLVRLNEFLFLVILRKQLEKATKNLYLLYMPWAQYLK